MDLSLPFLTLGVLLMFSGGFGLGWLMCGYEQYKKGLIDGARFERKRIITVIQK